MNAAVSARNVGEPDGCLPGLAGSGDHGDIDGEAVVRLLPMVRHVVLAVGRRYRIGRDDLDELHSLVCLKLVSDRYAVFRKFEGRSGLRTYLTTVVTRVWLDIRIARGGKWRPSAAASRLGPAAVALERLLTHDGCSLAEASRILTMNMGLARSEREARMLYESLPARIPRRRLVHDVFLEDVPAPPPGPSNTLDESSRFRAELAAALRTLPVEDRRLIVRRFVWEQTVAQIARELGLDQKDLYRRYDRLFVRIRALLGAGDTVAPRTRPPGVESGAR